MQQFVVGYEALDKNDRDLAGWEGAILGELTKLGIPLLPGFVVTAKAYDEFVKHNNLSQKTKHLANAGLAHHIGKYTQCAEIPVAVGRSIIKAYQKLGGGLVELGKVKTTGDVNLLVKIHELWREGKTVIVIQKVLNPELSGTLWTTDPKEKNKIRIDIDADSGLFSFCEVSKKDLAILFRIGSKLKDWQVLSLAETANKLQRYFYFPQKAKWIIANKKIYIVQVQNSEVGIQNLGVQSLKRTREILLKGKAFGHGISTGHVKIVQNPKKLLRINPREIFISSSSIKNAKGIVVSIDEIKNVSKFLHNGNIVTLNALRGELYRGGLQ